MRIGQKGLSQKSIRSVHELNGHLVHNLRYKPTSAQALKEMWIGMHYV